MQLDLSSKATRSVLVVVAVVIAIGWYFADAALDKSEAYEGVVAEKIARTRWGKWFQTTGTTKYKHYLVIESDSGERFTERVPRFVYTRFEEGDRVVKVKGERYPQKAP